MDEYIVETSSNKKKKGISGRSSNDDITQRVEIGKSLLINHTYKKRKSFFNAYVEKLKKNGLNQPSSYNTLLTDFNKMKEELKEKGIIFNNIDKTSIFEQFGSSMKGKIKHVNISVNGSEYILYDEQHKVLLKKYKCFKAPFKRQYKRYAIRLKTTKTKLDHFPMVHLYIITRDTSSKDYTALSSFIIESFLKYNEEEILYTAAHSKCAEIVFYKKDYEIILFNTYWLIKSACID